MSNNITPAFEEVADQAVDESPNSGVLAAISYEQAKPFLSGKPLRRTVRDRLLGNAPSFTYDQLSKWAENHKPPQSWYEEDDCEVAK